MGHSNMGNKGQAWGRRRMMVWWGGAGRGRAGAGPPAVLAPGDLNHNTAIYICLNLYRLMQGIIITMIIKKHPIIIIIIIDLISI